ncbi:MAG: tetratricopeptide repeat protein [Candidatus Brocadiia bacterium]
MLYWLAFVAVLIVGVAGYLAHQARQKAKARSAGRRQLELAIAKLTLELRHNPKNAALFCKRGTVRQRSGDLAGAMADFERGLFLDPNLAEAHYHHGMALEQKGDLAGAEKEFHWIVDAGNDAYYGTAAKERLDQMRGKKKSG